MRCEVLGPIRVLIGGRPVDLGSPQQRRLLALLLLDPDRPVPIDRLIDGLWGEHPPPTARHLVQVYVSRLRHVLDDAEGPSRIRREGPGYRLRVASHEVDASQLEVQVAEARHRSPEDAASVEVALGEAMATWRGRPFGDLASGSPALEREAQRLEALYLDAVEERMQAGLELGRHAELTGTLQQLTAEHPYRERLWEQLILALYRSDRQSAALGAYRTLHQRLAGDLGIDPSPDLQQLQRRMLLQDPTLQWQAPPPPSNVPTRLTSFVGRQRELADVAALLDAHRLVTLTGPGGIGKTRLAMEVADEVRPRFPDGVWWVDLAPILAVDGVVRALARTLGVTAQPTTPLLETLTRALTRRRLLLVIDNCEHVAAGVAEVAEAVLTGAADIRLLATSRVPLRLPGELLWLVPALGTPGDARSISDLRRADAVQLFADRARCVDPAFEVSEDNAAAVVEVCRRLDGIPLGIEMAAARVRVLTPAQIVEALGDRFAVLTARQHAPPPRHATLEAAFDWSYELLDPTLRPLFERLAVFVGAADLEAVDAVARQAGDPPTLEAMTELVEACLVTTVSGDDGLRYRLLETVRAYAADRLRDRGAEAPASRAHAEYHLGLARQAEAAIMTPDFATWTRRLDAVHDELRQALSWSAAHDGQAGMLAAAPALHHYWFRTGDAPEAGIWGERMLAVSGGARASNRAAAHCAVSFSATIRGDPAASRRHADEAVRLYREAVDHRGLVDGLFAVAQTAVQVGDLDGASRCSREALEVCERIGDRWGRAGALATLSTIHFLTGGSLEDARRLGEEALELHRQLGDIAGQAVMNPLPHIALRQRDVDAAEGFAADTVAAAVGTGWEGYALETLAQVYLARNEVDDAEVLLRRALTRALDAGLENWFRIALRDLAQVAVRRGAFERAAQLVGASRRGMPPYGLDASIYDPVETACRDDLGEGAYRAAVDEGSRLTHDQLLDLTGGSAVEGLDDGGRPRLSSTVQVAAATDARDAGR